jgi:hypothetical protein
VEHAIEFVHDGSEDVVVRTSGLGALRGLKAFVREMVGDDRYRPGMTVLVDHSELDPSALVTADARELAAAVAELGEHVHGTTVACVAPSAVMFGICRAFESYSSGSGLTSRVFSNADEARAWLATAKRAD